MKITNLLLNNIFLNKEEDILEVGNIFKGQIIEILGDKIIIDIKGRGNLHATMETDIELIKGDELSFLVKSSKGSKISLKPLYKEDTSNVDLDTQGKNSSITKLLKDMNIKESKLSIELTENLMKYNIPITKSNLSEGIKNLEKFFQLISLDDHEKVILLKDEDRPLELNIYKGTELNTNKENMVKADDLLIIEFNEAERAHIKNLIITDKEDYIDKKDLGPIIKENFNPEITKEQASEFIKILSFFMKNDIKPSLNNIKNLMEFNKNPIEYSKDFKEINNLLSQIIDGDKSTLLNKLDNFDLNISLLKDGNKLQELKQILLKLDSLGGFTDKREIRNLEGKIDFLVDLNKDLSYLVLPFNHGKDSLGGILTLLKENKKKRPVKEGINVFISLDTKNLGNVKASCRLVGSTITIKMRIQKDDLELFKSMEEQLVEKVLSIGYILNGIEFLVEEEIQIIDIMMTNPNPTYVLDIKV